MLAVGDRFPFDAVPAGTNLLVTGAPSVEKRDLAVSLLTAGVPEDDGVVYVSTTEPATAVASQLVPDGADAPPGDQVTVVECGETAAAAPEAVRTDTANATADLTSIAMAFSLAVEQLAETPYGPVRAGVHSLSPVLREVSPEPCGRFLQVVTRSVTSRDGLGVVTVDRPADDELVERLRPLFTGVLETRAAAGHRELRPVGVPGVDAEWTVVDGA
jgi:KaiC/GvpD/RAD55 family RecA-like ATPase